MKPRWLIGLAAIVVLGTPSLASAQHGAGGGFAPSGARVGAAFSAGATPHSVTLQRTSSNLPRANSAARTYTTTNVRGTAMPSRHAAFASPQRSPGFGSPYPVPTNPPRVRRNPPTTAAPVVYLLGVGGYYYAAPSDDSAQQSQDALQQQGQEGTDQADNQQTNADNATADARAEARPDAMATPSTPDQQDAAEQEPLPDVGTLILVLRDGSRLDVVAFTMTQGKIIYITPEGLRLTIAADILDAESTQRVNQERGTPMQLPL